LSHFNHPLSRVRKKTGYATIAPSGKERASSPTPTETGNTVAATTSVTTPKEDAILLKKGFPRVAVPSPFHGDRSKFNAYVLQIRLYW
jgi:hypothetical protein